MLFLALAAGLVSTLLLVTTKIGPQEIPAVFRGMTPVHFEHKVGTHVYHVYQYPVTSLSASDVEGAPVAALGEYVFVEAVRSKDAWVGYFLNRSSGRKYLWRAKAPSDDVYNEMVSDFEVLVSATTGANNNPALTAVAA